MDWRSAIVATRVPCTETRILTRVQSFWETHMAASPPLGPEVGAERSSDGEVARTQELRRPGRARHWSAARAHGGLRPPRAPSRSPIPPHTCLAGDLGGTGFTTKAAVVVFRRVLQLFGILLLQCAGHTLLLLRHSRLRTLCSALYVSVCPQCAGVSKSQAFGKALVVDSGSRPLRLAPSPGGERHREDRAPHRPAERSTVGSISHGSGGDR
jgi:hypothetical protein